MGWDAFAQRPDGASIYSRTANDLEVEDPALAAEFAGAADRAAAENPAVAQHDRLLRRGALDFSDCGAALAQATGRDHYGENWSAETVSELHASATWPEEPDWAAAHAREFLRVCTEQGLAIRFSW